MISADALRRQLTKARQLKEASIRQKNALTVDLFDLQVDFITNPAKRKTIICGRRSGKTHAISRYLVKTSLEHKDAIVLYLALTKPYAISLQWNLIESYLKSNKIPFKSDNLRHIIHLGDGAQIVFGGVNDREEREKFRGFPWRLVVCDETGSFGPYLSYLLEDVLQAALLDYDGTLVLSGTPSPQAAGAFYEAAHSPAYKHWHWTVLENPRIPQWDGNPKWKSIAVDFLAQIESTTREVKFKREYLGSWIRDTDSLLYMLDPGKNFYDEISEHHFDYVIGADTGYDDASAIVVLAASKSTRNVYIVSEWSKSGCLINHLAGQLKETLRRYPGAAMVIDTANKQLVESMKQIYSLPLQPADKQGKRTHIDIMNSALNNGELKFPRNSITYEQMSILEWNSKRTAESESFPADLADSLLYAYTHVFNHHNRKDIPKPMSELEWQKEEERKMIEKAISRSRGTDDDPLGYNEPEWEIE